MSQQRKSKAKILLDLYSKKCRDDSTENVIVYVLTWRQVVLLALEVHAAVAVANRSYRTVLQKNSRRPIRPVTSLGHQGGRRVFSEGPKFFTLCPKHFSRGAKIFLGELRPPAPHGYGPASKKPQSSSALKLPANDITFCVGKTYSNAEKLRILKNLWTPVLRFPLQWLKNVLTQTRSTTSDFRMNALALLSVLGNNTPSPE